MSTPIHTTDPSLSLSLSQGNQSLTKKTARPNAKLLDLNSNELDYIIKSLQNGKALPDQYRWRLFETKKDVELLWDGKTQTVTNVVLPFQQIEVVDEPRTENTSGNQDSIFGTDDRGRQDKGWKNKLIWGDNKLILSSLGNGLTSIDITHK